MPSQFWTAVDGAVNQQIELIPSGRGSVRQLARELVPADLVYPAPGGGLLRVPVGGGPAAQLRGSANGQLVYWDQAAGQWVATTAAPADGQQAQWNAATNTWDFVDPGTGSIEYFDLVSNTIWLYNHDNSIADSSGNGLNLTLQAGTYGYADIVPGKRGLRPANASRFGASSPLFQQSGALTIEIVHSRDSVPDAASEYIFCTVGAGGVDTDPANNSLFQFSILAGVEPPVRLAYFAEQGAGVNINYSTGSTAGSPSLGNIHELEYLAMTRGSDGQVQFYYNGLPQGARSVGLAIPNGGTNGTFAYTSLVTGTSPGRDLVMSCRGCAREFTAAEIKASFNRALGAAFGRVP